jgi:pyrroline-5-carboxylate reductase
MKEATGVEIVSDNTYVIKQAESIILAIKPQMMNNVLNEISTVISSKQRIISIAAGISTDTIEKRIGIDIPVIRVMPNTPALAGCSTTAICAGKYVTDNDMKFARYIFEAVGYVIPVDEHKMDIVTALSGCGPGYICMIIESLIDAGVELGLQRDIATELVNHTVEGTAKMLQKTKEHPAVLKNKVTSPGGATAAGLHVLEEKGLRGVIIQTVIAACSRTKELSK